MLTLEEAKAIYLKYDCSTYGMAMEEIDAYNEFRKLNISKTMREEWRQELFDALIDQLKSNGSEYLFYRIYKLAENGNRQNKERLLALKDALAFIKYEDLVVNACVSEGIMGRKALSVRSGMIFWAYDLGEYEMAKELVLYTMNLLSYQPTEERLKGRFERDRARCCLIEKELQLGCFK